LKLDERLIAVLQDQALSIDLIQKTLEQSNASALGQTLIGGLITTIVGLFIANMFTKHVEKRRVRQNRTSVVCKTKIDVVKRFDKCCFEYWSRDFDENKDPELERDIRYLHGNLRKSLDYLNQENPAGFDKSVVELKKAISVLYDEVLGNDFESKKRRRSSKIIRISDRNTHILMSNLLHYL